MANNSNLWIIAVLILISVLNWFIFSSFSAREYYTVIPFMFALQMLFNTLLENLLLQKIGSTKWFPLVVSPGTVLHEISHAIAALIAGCKISSISLFRLNSKTGVLGSVTYEMKPSRYSILKELFISFSPFFGCGAAMIILSRYLLSQSFNPNYFQASLEGVFQSIISNIAILAAEYSQLLSASLFTIFLLYLQFCFAFGAAPSLFDFQTVSSSAKRNLLNLAVAILILVIPAFLIQFSEYTGIAAELSIMLLNSIIMLLILSTAMILFSLLVIYSASQWLEASLEAKILSITGFIITYAIALFFNVSKGFALLLAWLSFLTILYLLKNQSLFFKKKSSR